VNERGQVTVLLLGLTLVCFAVAGLAVDGTRVFLAHRTLQNAADGAATAGAGEIDARSYYRSGGREFALDVSAARGAAGRWLALRGIGDDAEVGADVRAVSVTIRDHVPTSWLGLIGIDRIPVGATARARPIPGRP
jgi:uncharacterized membrane protein